MKLLVTGHSGYIGTAMVPFLVRAGHEVTGCDSELYERCTFPSDDGIEPIPALRKDIRDLTEADLEGFDAVIHLAALSNDALANLAPEVTYSINHHGSVRLAEVAKAAGVSRFIFASSCSNCGQAGDDMIDESGALNPITPYGQSKLRAERDIAPLADGHFCPVFLRPTAAFGMSPRMRFDLALNNLVAWATTTGLVRLKSDGTTWRPVVHIDDIARAFIAALEAPEDRVAGEAFNVGNNGHNYRLRDLAEIVVSVVPGCRLEFSPDDGADARSFRVNFDKIERALPDFRTEWDARRGAEQLYEIYRGSALTFEAFDGPRYQRIGHIQKLMAEGIITADLRSVSERPGSQPMTALAS